MMKSFKTFIETNGTYIDFNGDNKQISKVIELLTFENNYPTKIEGNSHEEGLELVIEMFNGDEIIIEKEDNSLYGGNISESICINNEEVYWHNEKSSNENIILHAAINYLEYIK